MVGTSPTQLDSLNELIKSEHFYVKYAPSSTTDISSSSGCGSDVDEVCLKEEEVQDSSSESLLPLKEESLSLTDDCFSFGENDMTLLQKFMKECLNSEEETISEESPELPCSKDDKTSDRDVSSIPTEETKTPKPIPAKRKRTSDDEVPEIINKLPKTDNISDSGSDSGVLSDYSNPNSPYQSQLLLQFNDMNPVDDILFPELFPCLI